MFEKDLEDLINYKSMENESNTPDFILAKFMKSCLDAYTAATKEREKWYGISLSIDSDLKDRLAKLEALEAAGVDNWEGYDIAMEMIDGSV